MMYTTEWPRSLASLATVALLSVTACGPGPDNQNDAANPSDGGADVADAAETADTLADVGVDTATDGGEADGAGADATTQGCPDPSAREVAEPTPVTIDQWTYGSPSMTGQLQRDIADGSFEMPASGSEKYGSLWKTTAPKESGEIPFFGFSGTIYAITTVKVDEKTEGFARVDEAVAVRTGGLRQPTDVYGHKDKRIPLNLHEGENLVVLRFSHRQSPSAEIFTTPDEVFFNKEDLTTPELRVGSQKVQPIGVQTLNLTEAPMLDLRAKVLENQYFKATSVEYPSLGPNALTQLAFRLEPKSAWSTDGETIPVEIRLESCATPHAYETTIELETVARDEAFRRTFRSPIDGSAQYYAVVPPENFDPNKDYGLALALHGASVEAKGHATAYSPKSWAYIVAPTNRRRFGFDWEEWGRLNGLSALEHARQTFNIDPTKVYVTGHSMGGHGTWHFGVMHPGRFAAIGPSAGWASFYTYGGADKPRGPVGRARAHSETQAYLSNLADRGAYIVHGSADNNVPVSEGRNLRDALRMHTQDVKYHEEKGADHWWDGQRAEGTDCVDWPPLFQFLKSHTLDPHDLDFEFTSPGPWVSAEHSYVTIRSPKSPLNDVVLESSKSSAKKVDLQTTNVRSMDIDGSALTDKGIDEIVIDGMTRTVKDETMEIGPRGGKRPGLNSTLNEAFRNPFCFVYPDDGPGAYRAYATYLMGTWSIRGNGHACALPVSQVDQKLREERNLIYLGVDFSEIPDNGDRPFSWRANELSIGSWSFSSGMAMILFPDGDRPAAAFVATEGSEGLLFGYQPFSSRAGLPDYSVLSSQGARALGFFDSEWKFDPSLGAR